jgi:hypothetical protein
MLASTDGRHQGRLQQLVSLSESRAGRLLMKKLLKFVQPESSETKIGSVQ